MKITYDIEKELENIKTRMYRTHFESDRIIIEDAINLIKELKSELSKTNEYDVENVVEAIKEKAELVRPVGWTQKEEIIRVKDAIEIVRTKRVADK